MASSRDTTLSARIADYHAALDFLLGRRRRPEPHRRHRLQLSVVKFPSPPKTLARQGLRPPCNTHPDPKHPPKNSSPNAGPPAISLSPQERGSHRLYFEDGERYDLCSAVAKLDRPTLIIHGSLDDDVPVEQAKELYAHAQDPKRLEIFEGAEHALRRPEDMERILELSLVLAGSLPVRPSGPSSTCTGPAHCHPSPCAGRPPGAWKAFP